VPSLAVRAAEHDERVTLVGRLDALGDRVEPEAVGEAEDGAHER
jgi:hypothetical protein